MSLFKLKPDVVDSDVKSGSLKKVKNWYTDRYQYVLVQRNILAVITLLGLAAALIATFSTHELAPLKSVKPFVIAIDQKTGATEVVNSTQIQELEANEAVKRYFLVKYIRAKESYDPNIFQENYNVVRLLSSRSVFNAYKLFMDPKNSYSPATRYARHSKRIVKVKSITFINPTTAQIRVMISSEGRLLEAEKPMVIWASFEFTNLDLSLEERYVNPLGFRVTSYRVDEEIS